MVTTVIKTIGTGGDYSTLPLWESGAPANLTTAQKRTAGSFTGSFTLNEILNFSPSGAVGDIIDTDGSTYIVFDLTSGTPASGDTVTGATSGKTCVITTLLDTGVIWQGNCKNQEFTAAGNICTLAGSTSSPTCYKFLTADTGASFQDNVNVQTNALRYNAANGAALHNTGTTNTTCLALNEDYSRTSRLQFLNDALGQILNSNSGTRTKVFDSILESTGGTGSLLQFGNFGFFSNCVIVNRSGLMTPLVTVLTNTGIELRNCTIVTPDDVAAATTCIAGAGAGGSPDILLVNCGIFAGDSTKNLVAGASTKTFIDCFSDISGTTGVTQVTYGSEFENVLNATRDFRLKTGAAQINGGSFNFVGSPNDIAGTPRPSGAFIDCGVWEYVQGFSTPVDISTPAGVTSAGLWTGENGATNLANHIDETYYDDSDYDQSSLFPKNDTMFLSLTDPVNNPGSDVIVEYRYGKIDGTAGTQIDLTVELYQGIIGPAIASRTHTNIPAFVQDGAIILSAAEVASITNFNSLHLRFTANAP